MKQPVTVTVSREHGNSGDVITMITDAKGETMKLAVPGDCSPYHALSALRQWFEGALNLPIEAADPSPKLAELQPATDEAAS